MLNWNQLLSTKRQRASKTKTFVSKDLRSEFEKDYHRIIGSASFRRLQDKTQVFPLDRSDFIRTRLTHSLEVSSFAKSLGQNIGESILVKGRDKSFTQGMKEDICNILQCAGLIHDIGNPPFGHFGEFAIRQWFQDNLSKLSYEGRALTEILSPQMQKDFYHFEGNAQAFRLVNKLHFLVDEHGMNLTYALLSTIVKYPVSSLEVDSKSGKLTRKKMGFFLADEPLFREVEEETGTKGSRHPLTFILEAADDIAYKTGDIEDGFVKGYISFYELLEALREVDCAQEGKGEWSQAKRLEQLYQRGKDLQVESPEEYAIKNWLIGLQALLIRCATFGFEQHYNKIMEGSLEQDLFQGTFAESIMKRLGRLAFEKVFTSHDIYRMEVAASVILKDLMDWFVPAALGYEEDGNLGAKEKRMMSLISSNYKRAYQQVAQMESKEKKVYLRLLLATDYICGMTDSYAKRLYQEMKGIL